MMQIVGCRIWAVRLEAGRSCAKTFIWAYGARLSRCASGWLSVTWDELLESDVASLGAMIEDAGNSRMADAAVRPGVSAGYAAQYRR